MTTRSLKSIRILYTAECYRQYTDYVDESLLRLAARDLARQLTCAIAEHGIIDKDFPIQSLDGVLFLGAIFLQGILPHYSAEKNASIIDQCKRMSVLMQKGRASEEEMADFLFELLTKGTGTPQDWREAATRAESAALVR